MSNITLPTKQHRTLLVLDASEGFDSVVAERFNRILQSVNSPGILVDVATFLPQRSSSSVALVPGAAYSGFEDDDDDEESVTIEDVKAAAAAAGYDVTWVASGNH